MLLPRAPLRLPSARLALATRTGCVRSLRTTSVCRAAREAPAALLPSPRPTLRALLSAQAQAASSTGASPPQTVRAWVRHIRDHKNVVFLTLTDGSLPAGEPLLQAVARGEAAVAVREAKVDAGASVELVGTLKPSRGRTAQPGEMELQVTQVARIASGNALANPLATPDVLTETAREHAHLRFRRSRDAAVLRARDRIDGGVAQWFRDHGFVHVTAPVITSSDCEGAGEVFQVMSNADVSDTLRRSDAPVSTPSSNGPAQTPQERHQQAMSRFWGGQPSYLTVSSQLHLEALALSLGRVWTETPSFRAERSATNRHLAEFRMLEAELAFIDAGGDAALDEVMDVVQGVVRAAIRASLLTNDGTACPEAEALYAPTAKAEAELSAPPESGPSVPLRPSELALDQVLSWARPERWPRLSYTDAVALLQASADRFASGAPQWGEGLGSEHERWLASVHGGGGPIFITRYPAAIKPFYMRATDTPTPYGPTVDAFDLLIPALGELAGGSLREERPDILQRQIEQAGMDSDATAGGGKLGWYSDLRAIGSAPHGGFGIGVERLVSVLTHTDNVRDCVPFSTTVGALRF